MAEALCHFWSYFSFLYSSSLTGSSHSVELFSPGTSIARCENHSSGAAPCQCLTPVGILMQSPGYISTASLPSSVGNSRLTLIRSARYPADAISSSEATITSRTSSPSYKSDSLRFRNSKTDPRYNYTYKTLLLSHRFLPE